jgi:type I restriction enzyme S subunit
MEMSPIAQGVLPIDNWSPQSAEPTCEFEYIDIGSIDRESKTIYSTSRLRASNAPSRARQLLKAGDVLVSTVRPNLNAVAVVPERLSGAIASTGFCVLRCNPRKLYYRYLFHWVCTKSFVMSLVQQATGASYPAVSDRIVKEARVPVPPLSEQKRIADILDKANSVRVKRRAQRAAFCSLPHAIFIEMFGHPDPNPKGWPSVSFSEVCESRLGKMLDAKRQTGDHCRPYMRNLNVQWGHLDMSEVFQMDFDEADRAELRLRFGDVLICEGGAGVGQTAIWRDELPECYFQKSLHRVRPLPDRATPEYIAYLMWTLMKGSSLLRWISSATIPHLTGVKLKKLLIPVPPIELQREYQRLILKYDEAMTNANRASADSLSLFASLIDQAFRGEL